MARSFNNFISFYSRRLKAELQALRRRGALRPSAGTPATAQPAATLSVRSPTVITSRDWNESSSSGATAATTGLIGAVTAATSSSTITHERTCARCRIELGRIINRGAICRACRQRVCKACREFSNTSTDWLCCVCHKHM